MFALYPFIILHKYIFHRYRHNLLFELAGSNRGGGLLVRVESKLVGRLTGNIVFLGNRFGGKAHAGQVVGSGRGYLITGRQLVARHGDHTHIFSPSGDVDLAHTGFDLGDGYGDGLQAGGAIAVDGHTRYLLSQGPHGYLPADLQALLPFRVGATDDNVIDQPGVQFRRLAQQVLDDIYRQVIGTVVPESSFFGFAYSRAIGLNDICFHVCFFLINSDSK